MQCTLCEFKCDIPLNGVGKCRMYKNRNDILVERFPNRYLVSVPATIEAMPMVHFYPNARFLQICTLGCNFKCGGCVSWLLTENASSVESALENIGPQELVQKAIDEGCKGIMFCFNEPTVSFYTFKKITEIAREKGLLVGCATNGYFTEQAFWEFIRNIDFINVGIKGYSDRAYNELGAVSFEPVYRNIELCYENGIHTEVAGVYIKGMETEIIEAAGRVASISKDIPFQIMRFLPLCKADYDDEPSIKEGESLCERLKGILNFVYLFNSPGTEYLNTSCPDCGRVIIRRGFNGPMASNVIDYAEGDECDCGRKMPYKGYICTDNGIEALGYFGGYKNIMALENIRTILAFLGENDSLVISKVLLEILKTDYIRELYPRLKKVESYLDTVDYYAKLAGRKNEAKALRQFIEDKVGEIITCVRNADRPRVYFALNHPLIAVFGDKFECNLVETAGGNCVNKEIKREEIPGIKIPIELLNKLNPEIILVNGSHGYPASDVHEFLINKGITVAAVNYRRIYNIHPYHTAGSPDWILGLLYLANIIHPELFDFDLKKISDEFYNNIFGLDYEVLNHNRTFDVLCLEKMKKAQTTAGNTVNI